MNESILLNVDTLHRLMRIFIEHQADILPVVERGRIVGQLDRLSIMEALSEIRPEGCYLQLKPAESAEDLLKRLDASADGGIPTVNRAFEFNALWGRAEILQAQGKIPQVRIWQPEPATAMAAEEIPAVAANPALPFTPQIAEEPAVQEKPPLRATAPKAVAETEAYSAPATEVNGATITIVRETPASREPQRPRREPAGNEVNAMRAPAEKIHRELERGRLAINTLAALELPLMACDGSGTELFHNRAFGDLRTRFTATLNSAELVRKAKDVIAESALKGDLDIERPVKLRANIQGYSIYCKAIRDYEDPSARAQGYIFWLEAAQPARTLTADWNAAAGDDRVNFSGRTLPEILAAEESRAMAWAMREANGNQSDAALLLGIPRQTFNYRFRKLARQQAGRAAHRKNEKPKDGKEP